MAISENGKSRHHSQTDKGPGDWEINDFIGVSREAKEVRNQLDWLASDIMANCIMLTGESGVGKDLVANILQSKSVNAIDKLNMVHVDGGTLFIENVQSALFGHVKGAYTGSTECRKGCFRSGDRGTVFLNEIGNLTLNIQPMLLRVIEYRVVMPLGCDKEEKVNPLMIFATNRDLDQMCAEERFMPDLLKRMQRYQLHIPPLRERKEDIPILTDFLYRKICLESKASLKPKIDKNVYDVLSGCELRGNARELENILIAAFNLMRRNNEEVLMSHHLCFLMQKPVEGKQSEIISGPCINQKVIQYLRILNEQEQRGLNGRKG